ncbi:FG-GAP repeat protein [Myxococcus landrumensis]|uniref:FG-GAP repeat protein n=1 Tax=Myxococcus landrumensis TaxID=2813577 RepID=UPI0035316400
MEPPAEAAPSHGRCRGRGWIRLERGDVWKHGAHRGAAAGNLQRGAQCGSVYIFVRDGSTWSLQQRLRAAGSDRAAEDRFGWSVALKGDHARVGVPG